MNECVKLIQFIVVNTAIDYYRRTMNQPLTAALEQNAGEMPLTAILTETPSTETGANLPPAGSSLNKTGLIHSGVLPRE